MASKKITLETIAASIQKMDKQMGCGFAAVAEDISKLATKDELSEVEKNLSDRIDIVKSKADGIQRSLDVERVHRTDLKIPRRLHDVEEQVYGVGGSKHPKHVPL